MSVAGLVIALRTRWWAFADAERQSLALWLPVAFAAGLALWFTLPWQSQRLALALGLAGIAGFSLILNIGGWRW